MTIMLTHQDTTHQGDLQGRRRNPEEDSLDEETNPLRPSINRPSQATCLSRKVEFQVEAE